MPNYRVVTSLNAYNEEGIGVQSIRIAVKHADDGRTIRPTQAYQDPTIGVICSGLIGKGAKTALVEFPVDVGKAEFLKVLSMGGLYIDDGNSDRYLPKKLATWDSVFVKGPAAVRTLVELQNPDPDKIREIVHHGVYACEYWNIQAR